MEVNQHEAKRLRCRLEDSIKPRLQSWQRRLGQPCSSGADTTSGDMRGLCELEQWLQKAEDSLKHGETGVAEARWQLHSVTKPLIS